jgi:hypothetical protein
MSSNTHMLYLPQPDVKLAVYGCHSLSTRLPCQLQYHAWLTNFARTKQLYIGLLAAAAVTAEWRRQLQQRRGTYIHTYHLAASLSPGTSQVSPACHTAQQMAQVRQTGRGETGSAEQKTVPVAGLLACLLRAGLFALGHVT